MFISASYGLIALVMSELLVGFGVKGRPKRKKAALFGCGLLETLLN